MQELLHKLMNEWERVLLTVVGIIWLIAVSLFFVNLFAEHDGKMSTNTALPAKPAFINMNSLAYMDAAKMDPQLSPLRFFKQLPVTPGQNTPPPKKQEAKKEEPKKDPPKQEPKKDPPKKEEPKKEPPKKEEPQKPTPPPPPPRVIKVLYRGMMKGTTDTEYAFIVAQDSKTKKTVRARFSPGTKLFDVLEVSECDKDKLVVKPQGKEVTVVKGVEQEVVVE